MPAQVGKSGLLGKVGNAIREAHETHKADETVFSAGGDLPAGIEGGIAQLVDCKFDTYKKGDNTGQYYFYAAGVVVEPKVFTDEKGNVIPVEGRRTSIMEPLCETPGRTRESIEEHYAWILNELRKLGLDTSGLEADGIEDAVEALRVSGPFFNFRTWKGPKAKTGPYKDQEPRVNHVWNGVTEYHGADDSGVADSSGDVDPESNGASKATAPAKAAPAKAVARAQAPAATNKPAATTAKAGPGKKVAPKPAPEPEPEPDPEEVAEGGDNWDELATQADGQDEDAQIQLTEAANGLGITDEDINKVANWGEVVELMRTAASGAEPSEGEEGGEEAAEPEEIEYKKGNLVGYSMIDAKTKKAKIHEAEVLTADKAKQTVTLKLLSTGKPVVDAKTNKPKAIPWSALTDIPA